MEIIIDLDRIGYVAGRGVAKLIKYGGIATLARSGFRNVEKIAAAHKINSSDADAVSKNLFDCLPFIE